MFFDGKAKPSRVISGSSKKSTSIFISKSSSSTFKHALGNETNVLELSRKVREMRSEEKLRNQACIKIQSLFRGYFLRNTTFINIRELFYQLENFGTLRVDFSNQQFMSLSNYFFYFYDPASDEVALNIITKILSHGMDVINLDDIRLSSYCERIIFLVLSNVRNSDVVSILQKLLRNKTFSSFFPSLRRLVPSFLLFLSSCDCNSTSPMEAAQLTIQALGLCISDPNFGVKSRDVIIAYVLGNSKIFGSTNSFHLMLINELSKHIDVDMSSSALFDRICSHISYFMDLSNSKVESFFSGYGWFWRKRKISSNFSPHLEVSSHEYNLLDNMVSLFLSLELDIDNFAKSSWESLVNLLMSLLDVLKNVPVAKCVERIGTVMLSKNFSSLKEFFDFFFTNCFDGESNSNYRAQNYSSLPFLSKVINQLQCVYAILDYDQKSIFSQTKLFVRVMQLILDKKIWKYAISRIDDPSLPIMQCLLCWAQLHLVVLSNLPVGSNVDQNLRLLYEFDLAFRVIPEEEVSLLFSAIVRYSIMLEAPIPSFFPCYDGSRPHLGLGLDRNIINLINPIVFGARLDASASSSHFFASGYSSLVSICQIVLFHQLFSRDDEEFSSHPLFVNYSIQDFMNFLVEMLFSLFWKDEKPIYQVSSAAYSSMLLHLQHQLVSSQLFHHFMRRNERRNFLLSKSCQWKNMTFKPSDLIPLDPSLISIDYFANLDSAFSAKILMNSEEVVNPIPHSSSTDLMHFSLPQLRLVLLVIPHVLSFEARYTIFSNLLQRDKQQFRDEYSRFHSSPITIRRDRILEDAYEQLSSIDFDMKSVIRVSFVSASGNAEAGIDGGGLFKDFIEELIKAAITPELGYFISSSDNLLLISPLLEETKGSHALSMLYFFGKMLGKAIYENILVEPQFSLILLNLLLGKVNDFDELYLLDTQLYRSLLELKNKTMSHGDISQLFLFFETSYSVNGKIYTKEIVPGGSQIRVTSANLRQYIHRLANYKLNIESYRAVRAFTQGLHSLLPEVLLRFFNGNELQQVISGENNRRLDIQDLRRNTVYGGGFDDQDPYVDEFWALIDSFSVPLQQKFLKFVTSCSRPPPLGFSQLNPKFGVQQVLITRYLDSDAPRLPTSSTCVNLLKLPRYDDINMLRDKLILAIESNCGFELS